MDPFRSVRWPAVIAAICAVQIACGRGEDARYVNTDEPGIADATESREVQVTGCVERGVIPGSYMLTNVRAEHGAGPDDTRATSGVEADGESAIGERDRAAEGSAGPAMQAAYTLRALDGRNLGDYVGRRVSVEGRLLTNQALEGETVGTGGDTPQTGAAEGMSVERPGGSMAATGASMPLHQLAAERIEAVDGECGTGEAEIGGGDQPARP